MPPTPFHARNPPRAVDRAPACWLRLRSSPVSGFRTREDAAELPWILSSSTQVKCGFSYGDSLPVLRQDGCRDWEPRWTNPTTNLNPVVGSQPEFPVPEFYSEDCTEVSNRWSSSKDNHNGPSASSASTSVPGLTANVSLTIPQHQPKPVSSTSSSVRGPATSCQSVPRLSSFVRQT